MDNFYYQMPSETTQRIIDKHMERSARMIAMQNKRHTCGPVLKNIKKRLKKQIEEGKCGKDCQDEIKDDIKNITDNCGKKAAKKFEKEIGMKKFKDNIKLKF